MRRSKPARDAQQLTLPNAWNHGSVKGVLIGNVVHTLGVHNAADISGGTSLVASLHFCIWPWILSQREG